MMVRHKQPDEEGTSPVTDSQCRERMKYGTLKWAVLLTAIGGLGVVTGWTFAIADGARTTASAVEMRLEVERATNAQFHTSVDKAMEKIEVQFKTIDDKLEKMRGFFNGQQVRK